MQQKLNPLILIKEKGPTTIAVMEVAILKNVSRNKYQVCQLITFHNSSRIILYGALMKSDPKGYITTNLNCYMCQRTKIENDNDSLFSSLPITRISIIPYLNKTLS